METSK